MLTMISLAACAGLPVHGRVGGQSFDTRVDAEVAQYYLANYLSGRRTDPVLDQRISPTASPRCLTIGNSDECSAKTAAPLPKAN